VGNKQERLSLVEEDISSNVSTHLDGAKLTESTKGVPYLKEEVVNNNNNNNSGKKNSENLLSSTQAYSPPSS